MPVLAILLVLQMCRYYWPRLCRAYLLYKHMDGGQLWAVVIMKINKNEIMNVRVRQGIVEREESSIIFPLLNIDLYCFSFLVNCCGAFGKT